MLVAPSWDDDFIYDEVKGVRKQYRCAHFACNWVGTSFLLVLWNPDKANWLEIIYCLDLLSLGLLVLLEIVGELWCVVDISKHVGCKASLIYCIYHKPPLNPVKYITSMDHHGLSWSMMLQKPV